LSASERTQVVPTTACARDVLFARGVP
jgi:hypothetical protein